ncbi:MAG: recombinase family protein [Selenomonas sp.]|uniref:recombinase family protein n=1 Tax=Selenomonas sp. TaxID=2053611 RepID=UPI0025DE063A|nr:recombinase family protein [Selenomonas sp.]MCI6086924.1 recombinase family protein [Selenomonas sp.]
MPTPGGCKNWSQSTIRSILTNEKYKGDALLQKRYTVNFLTKEMRDNKGEVPQYYVEHNHEAIISPAVFDQVQEELERRRHGGNRYSGVSIYSSQIKCGDCGGWYGAKVWHSTDKYRKTIYRCNNKFKHHCKTPHLTEADIQQAFLRAVNKFLAGKTEIIENIRNLQATLCQTDALEQEQARHEADMNALAEMTEQCIAENARIAQDQSAYQKRYDDLARRYDEAKKAYEDTVKAIQHRKTRAEQLDGFIQTLEAQAPVTGFDETLWSSLVDCITVYGEGDVRVTFKDGTEIKA